jgi:hypothetical protein
LSQWNRYRKDNPVRGIERYPDRKSERFLSTAELKALADVLSAAENAWGVYQQDLQAWQRDSCGGLKPKVPLQAVSPNALAAIRIATIHRLPEIGNSHTQMGAR